MLLRAALATGVAFLAAPQLARADPSPVWDGNGITGVASGGVTGFMDKAVRDVVSSDVGGAFDLRLTLGSRRPLALDISYLGNWANLHDPAGAAGGVLDGMTFEAACRYNFNAGATWDPYAFVGLGWQHYEVRGATVDLMNVGMRSHDDLVDAPLGAGLAFHHEGFVLDVRATLRVTQYNNLVRDTRTTYAAMDSWQVGAGIGYEL